MVGDDAVGEPALQDGLGDLRQGEKHRIVGLVHMHVDVEPARRRERQEAVEKTHQLVVARTFEIVQRMLMVYLYMDHGAHSLVTVKGRGINTLQDLAGKKIGRTTGDIIGPLWPAFRRMHGIDDSKIEWMSVTPQLRDTLLMQG